jgi:hypothetical protein
VSEEGDHQLGAGRSSPEPFNLMEAGRGGPHVNAGVQAEVQCLNLTTGASRSRRSSSPRVIRAANAARTLEHGRETTEEVEYFA